MPARVPDDLWIVIAAYNEGRRIGATLRELREHGYTPERIDDLLARKVVFDADYAEAAAAESMKIPAE